MAIAFVGGTTATKAGATSGNSTIALNSGLTGGSRSSVQAGDLVIAVFVTGSTVDRTLAITDGTTNYTLIGSELYSNGTSYDTNLRVAYKFMGSTPDTSTTFGPTGNAADAGAMCVYVFSGVDSGTPLDVAATTATGTATGRPNGAAITPTTSGAYVVVAGGGAAATGAVYTQSGTELSGFKSATSADTQDAMIGIGYKAWTSGAFDPVVWTGGTANAADSWAAVTVALRPQAATIHDTSGTLTGQGAAVVGSAAHIAKHDTSGALTGQGAAVVGSATRFRAFDTTGALVGQGAAVSGSAAHIINHATSGDLVGQGAAVVGSASQSTTRGFQYDAFQANAFQSKPIIVTHATSGALVGQGASVSGASSRFRAMDTTGALVGQGASVSGSSARTREHATTGTLAGQGAAVGGSAVHNVLHTTTGVLAGQGAAVTGSAARTREHATTGVLTGSGSAVSGTSVHNVPHPTSGSLVGQGSELVGYANRGTGPVTHDTSGSLVGQGAAVSGSSARAHEHASTGTLTGQGAEIVGSATLTKLAVTHDTSGVLVGSGAVVVGSASGSQSMSGGGIYPATKQRKKNIVNIDGTLYVFNSAREAVDFLNQQEESATNVIDKKPEPVKPIREIRLSQVETLAKVFTIPEVQNDIYQSIQLHNYADVIKAYDRFIEQDDEEALLLLM